MELELRVIDLSTGEIGAIPARCEILLGTHSRVPFKQVFHHGQLSDRTTEQTEERDAFSIQSC